jgi:hypothetical protein
VTFYIFVDITRSGLISKEIAGRLIEQASVTTVPGIEFVRFGGGFLRVKFAVKELQVLSLTLFEKLPLIQLLDKSNNNPMFIEDSIQLNLFDNLLGH